MILGLGLPLIFVVPVVHRERGPQAARREAKRAARTSLWAHRGDGQYACASARGCEAGKEVRENQMRQIAMRFDHKRRP